MDQKLNKQETFNRVARHLLTQKERAVLHDEDMMGTVCRYRADNGRTCAVGCLIPDSIYTPKMEGRTADGLFWDFPEFKNIFDGTVPSEFLNQLQRIHDNHECESWLVQLSLFASAHGLDTEVFKEFQ